MAALDIRGACDGLGGREPSLPQLIFIPAHGPTLCHAQPTVDHKRVDLIPVVVADQFPFEIMTGQTLRVHHVENQEVSLHPRRQRSMIPFSARGSGTLRGRRVDPGPRGGEGILRFGYGKLYSYSYFHVLQLT